MSVHVEPSGAVRLVTIDRPDRRNALDADHVEALRAAVADAPAGARALVLQGVEGHFCAGADLKGIEGPEFATLLRGLLHAWNVTTSSGLLLDDEPHRLQRRLPPLQLQMQVHVARLLITRSLALVEKIFGSRR